MLKNKILLFFSISTLVIASLFNIPTYSQTANNTIEMYPGQSRVFTVTYGNDGDMSNLENAILDIRIGSFLTVNRNSLKDKFDGGTEHTINFDNVSVSSGLWGTRINYRPFSGATGGSSTPGNVEIEPGKNGIFTFEATLDPNIIGKEDPTSGDVYQYDSTLSVSDLQGVNSVLNFTNGETIPGNLNITIIRNPNQEEEEEEEEEEEVRLSTANITVNPSDPSIGQAVTISVSNLARNDVPVTTGQCQVSLSGGDYQRNFTANIQNGRCEVIVDANQSPTVAGEYNIIATLDGQRVGSRNVTFGIPRTALPRTGGIALSVILVILGGIFSLVVFKLSQKRKMKIK